MTDLKQSSSPYRYGADQGFFFGLYLSLMFIASVMSVEHPTMSVVFLAMFCAVPAILYRWLRRAYVESRATLTLSALWLQGIVIFVCGTMIAAVIAIAYLRFIDPEFIIGRVRDIIDLYRSQDNEDTREIARILENMISMKMIPTAGAIVMETVWIGIFSGSILSLITGAIARSRRIPVRD